MPTECRPDFFGFEPVEGREVVAAFDAGAMTSDAGALLLGATDRVIRIMDRFASCFHDERRADLIEHKVATLVSQRVFRIALGYEDLNDHDELRHDPLMAVLAGKLEARREDYVPVAGKSTLNRLELSRLEPTRYHKISHNPMAIKRLLVEMLLEAHERAPNEIVLDLDATDDPLHGEQEGRFFHGYYDCYCYLPLYVFCGRHCWPPNCGARTSTPRPARWRRWRASSPTFAAVGRWRQQPGQLLRRIRRTWSLELIGDSSETKALTEYIKLQKRFPAILGSRTPVVLKKELGGRGSALWYQIRLTEDSANARMPFACS